MLSNLVNLFMQVNSGSVALYSAVRIVTVRVGDPGKADNEHGSR